MHNNTPSIKKNVLLNTLYEILAVIAPFITAPYISRVLGAEKIGIYSYTTSIQMYFSLFAALGTAQYGLREISRSRNDKEKLSKFFFEIEGLSIITSCICLLLWGIFVFFSNEYKLYYLILTLSLLNTMFDISWFYRGLEQFKYTVTRNSLVKISGIILLFLLVKTPEDLFIYFLIRSGTDLLGTLSMWITLPRFIQKTEIRKLNIVPHIKETFIYFIPTIATSIFHVMDKTLIGIITKDPNENGYYEQAQKILNIVKALVFTSLNVVMGARLSYLFEQNKIDEIKEHIRQSINYITFIGFGCTFGLIGIADRFVPIFFGAGYDKTIVLLQVMSPIIVFLGISSCLGTHYYNPAGLRAKSARFLIIGAICNFILNITLIPFYKSTGAAIGTIVAEFVVAILYTRYCDNYITFSQIWIISWRKIIASILMLGLIILMNKLSINSVVIICLQITGGGLVYIIILLILKDPFLKLLLTKIINKLKK